MNDITLAGTATAGLRPIEAGDSAFAALRADAVGSTAILVLGMHRSGTSALTGMLHHLGVALGGNLMPASPDNPRGYWEHADIVAAHEQILAGLGSDWDDIRALPEGFEHSETAAEGRRKLAAILGRDFDGAALWGLKDPRLCRLMPLWSMLLDAERIAPRYILAVRHPLDVAASLDARDGISPARALLLWLATCSTRSGRRAASAGRSCITRS